MAAGRPASSRKRCTRHSLVPSAGKHLAGHVGAEHVDRHLLAHALDRAIGVGGDRRAGRRHVSGDQEGLVLLDLTVARQHGARDRSARVDGEPLLTGQVDAARAAQAFARLEGASGPARERAAKS